VDSGEEGEDSPPSRVVCQEPAGVGAAPGPSGKNGRLHTVLTTDLWDCQLTLYADSQ
jgi:hypothetical protein